MLPCDVTVESVKERRTVVRSTDPEALLGADRETSADLASIARDARERMMRVFTLLQQNKGARALQGTDVVLECCDGST